MLHPDERRLILTALRASYSDFKTVAGHVQYLTGAALIRGETRTWAYFQPSEECQDWIDNLKAWRSQVAPGVEVHAGFLEQYLLLASETSIGFRDYYLGHSLGAAIATLFCWANPNSAALVTGCPRVGNRGFVNAMTGRRVDRIEASGDPVTHLPPYLCGYRHCGAELKLLGPSAWWERLLRMKSVHFPATYIHAIESET